MPPLATLVTPCHESRSVPVLVLVLVILILLSPVSDCRAVCKTGAHLCELENERVGEEGARERRLSAVLLLVPRSELRWTATELRRNEGRMRAEGGTVGSTVL